MPGYKIDIAFVIDATGSMEPFMDMVKSRALIAAEKIIQHMGNAGYQIENLRMRVIDFADFASESTDTIHASRFFNMPEEREEFKNRILGIEYEKRGGDIPENALEALWVAMNSDWVDLPVGTKGRHIIVLVTDAPPLNLKERLGCEGYVPEDYPEDISVMDEIWNEESMFGERITKMHPRYRRLVLFSPEGGDDAGHSWDNVSAWAHTIYVPVSPENGLIEVDFDILVNAIVRSV